MSKRRKKADMRVRFNDEAPRIGTGVRGINIVKVGRKWVRIRETATGAEAKLKREVFNRLQGSVKSIK